MNAILTRDGRTLEISWYDAVLSDATGKVTGLLCTGQDVTDWRMLEREVLEISKAEQRRIGHDLHDGVCQELTGLGLLAQGLADQLAAETASVALETAGILNLCEVARRLSEGIGSATSHTRDLSHSLIPAAIDTLGLQISLEELAVSTNSLHDIVCSFECDASIHVADSVAETHLYRIAQEAVANAAKHSEAKNIRIALLKKENRVTLQVQDDGNGRSTVRQDSNGLGQRIMKYRADLIGAQLEIQANEGRGTVVTCRLPQGRVREQ